LKNLPANVSGLRTDSNMQKKNNLVEPSYACALDENTVWITADAIFNEASSRVATINISVTC